MKLQRNLFVTQDGVIVGGGGSPLNTSGTMQNIIPIDESSGRPVSDPYLPVKSTAVTTPKVATNWYVVGGIFLFGYFLLRR